MGTRSVMLACCLALLFALPLQADAALDALFNPAVMHDIRITMSENDWALLRANYQSNTEYDATLMIDGEVAPGCSIRSRGSGTRNPFKPGLRVDFDHEVKSRRFHGLENLVIDNMYHDPSFLREQLAFAIFRQMGVLVPRESFARLTVNGQYWGLYAVIEPIDQVFVTTHVDRGGGNLFEYNAPSPTSPDVVAWDFTLSRGQEIEDYIPEPFEPKTNEDDLDGSALLAFIRTVTDSPDATFVSEISEFIDPRLLLTYYAVEVATAEVDGLTSFFGVNNFYLYQFEGTNRFLFIPWDHDFNFTTANHNIYYGIHRNRLINRLLSDPELRTFYRDTLSSIMTTQVNPGAMAPRIDSMVALIRASVLEDTKRQGGDNPATSAQTFDNAVNQVRTVIAGRGASVEAQLNQGRQRGVRP